MLEQIDPLDCKCSMFFDYQDTLEVADKEVLIICKDDEVDFTVDDICGQLFMLISESLRRVEPIGT